MMAAVAQFLNSRTTAHIPGNMRTQIPFKETQEQMQDNTAQLHELPLPIL
jgi:hypothetical protein